MDSGINEASLAHDITALNKEIIQNIDNVVMYARQGTGALREHEKAALNIKYASEMIGQRLAIYNFLKNPERISLQEKRTSAHRSLMKIKKILDGRAEIGKKKIIVGHSRIEFMCSKYFENALFVVMENCVKYSPNNSDIDIQITEDDQICIDFINYGPKLNSGEEYKVFELEYRGEAARRHTELGHGIGLFFVKQICDAHGHVVSLTQDESLSVDYKGSKYPQTHTKIGIPIDG